MDEGFRAQDVKITKLIEDVADMRVIQKAINWMIAAVGTLASLLLTAGKALHWI